MLIKLMVNALRKKNVTDADHLNFLNAVSPSTQLGDVYRDSVFDNKDLAAQLPSHLSEFSIFNVATELRTYTTESKNSSDFALDKISNSLLFDDTNAQVRSNKASTVAMESFVDSDRAFYGDLMSA